MKETTFLKQNKIKENENTKNVVPRIDSMGHIPPIEKKRHLSTRVLIVTENAMSGKIKQSNPVKKMTHLTIFYFHICFPFRKYIKRRHNAVLFAFRQITEHFQESLFTFGQLLRRFFTQQFGFGAV